MKFAIKYYEGCRVLPVADEIIIKYKHKAPDLIHFVQEYKDNQRIIINITEITDKLEDSLEIIEAAAKVHPNFAVMLSQDQNYIHFVDRYIPFFFIEGASTLDEVYGMTKLGVSDIYIINELGFNLEKVSKYCHNLDVAIRVYPNVAQSSTNIPIEGLTKFFIRPDAVKIYEDYVDVFEFFGTINRQAVLYDIYKDERWLGPLKQIILELNDNIDNRTVVPYFDIARVGCEKRCILSRCGVCSKIKDFGKTLEEKELSIIRKRAIHAEDEYTANESALPEDAATINEDISGVSEE